MLARCYRNIQYITQAPAGLVNNIKFHGQKRMCSLHMRSHVHNFTLSMLAFFNCYLYGYLLS